MEITETPKNIAFTLCAILATLLTPLQLNCVYGKNTHSFNSRKHSQGNPQGLSEESFVAAAKNGNLTAVQNFIANNDNVTIISRGTTALILASGYGHIDIVKALLNAIPNTEKRTEYTNLQNHKGQTALSWAASQGHLEIVRALLTAIPDTEKRTEYTNRQDYENKTALSWAAFNGHLEIVNALLNAGAHDTPDREGIAALSWAAFNGHLEIVNALLNAIPNTKKRTEYTNLQNHKGQTALSWAASQGHLEIVRALLTAIPDTEKRTEYTNLQNHKGQTALSWAAFNGHPEIVNALLNAGAQDTPDLEGKTALSWAAGNGHLEIVRDLLNAGAQDTPDLEGKTALSWAASQGHLEIVRALLNAGAQDTPDLEGKTALSWAASNGDEKGRKSFKLKKDENAAFTAIVNLLLKYGADVAGGKNCGITPLQNAVIAGNIDSIQLLLTHAQEHDQLKMVIDAQSPNKRTALNWALRMSHKSVQKKREQIAPETLLAIVKLLIEYGANSNIPDASGRTPIYWASELKLEEIRQLLSIWPIVCTLCKKITAETDPNQANNMRKKMFTHLLNWASQEKKDPQDAAMLYQYWRDEAKTYLTSLQEIIEKPTNTKKHTAPVDEEERVTKKRECSEPSSQPNSKKQELEEGEIRE